jgi:hypothetical protein
MKQLTILCCFLITIGYSQSVQTALNINKPEDFRPGVLVSEVTSNMTFYNSNGTIEKKKEVTVLNAQHRVTSEQRYNEEGTLTQRLTWRYDSTGTKSLGRKLERWHKLMGYSCETSFHEYDANGFLVQTVEKDKDQQVFRITSMKNDDHGNTVELTTTDGQGNLYGQEQVTYDYNNNLMTIKYFNGKGEMISENSGKIDYVDKNDNSIEKNEFGDTVKSADFEYEYKYDKKGNWTFMTIYKIKLGKKVKQSEFSRKIKYTT